MQKRPYPDQLLKNWLPLQMIGVEMEACRVRMPFNNCCPVPDGLIATEDTT